jgi:hypothetical protein
VFVLQALALILGLLVARVRGGTLGALGRIRVRMPWLVVGIVGALVAAAFVPGARPVAWLVAALCAAVISVANRRIPGLILLFVGLALNAAVITANHGQMPVSTAAISSAGLDQADFARSSHYRLAGAGTALRPLGDVIPFRFWGAPTVLSGGDALAAAGVGLFAALAPVRASRSLRARRARRDRRRRRQEPPPAGDEDDQVSLDGDLADLAEARGGAGP